MMGEGGLLNGGESTRLGQIGRRGAPSPTNHEDCLFSQSVLTPALQIIVPSQGT